MACHKKGVESYFPSTSFVSGKGYNYSVSENKITKCTDHDNMNVDKDNENLAENTKDPAIVDETELIQDTTNIKKVDIVKSKVYECTEDCIGASNEDCTMFYNVVHTFCNATKKDVRNIIDKHEYCSNLQPVDIYRLPVEKRNHPQICYEQGCEGYSVLIRKLAIHHKNCRRFLNILTELNIAHSFIHDIDMATVLADIDYLIKLVALPPNKQPSVFSSRDSPSIDIDQMKKNLCTHIANYESRCQNLPDTVCQSCYILESKQNTRKPKDNWKHIDNKAWKDFKKMLDIESFQNENIEICYYCVLKYNTDQIPPRSRLNNMDLGICPKEITRLTPIELMFISKAKVFQTVIKLGAVGRNVPQNSRLSALKGNCIHMPLPLEHTIRQLADDVGFTKLPSNYIMTHHIKGNELLLRNLVNLDNVYEALVWLKNNNDFYRDIKLPPRSDLLFTSLSSQHLPDPPHSSELASSYVTGEDVEQAENNLENFDACSTHTRSSNEESLVKNRKDNGNNKAQNKSFKTINTGSAECNVINNQENPPGVLEQVELDIENNPSEMIQRLSSLQIQGMLEQYSVVDTDIKRNTIMDVQNFYELLKIDSEPFSYKVLNIDMMAFPNIFSKGKGGQDCKRVYLTHKMYEKTRLLSGNGAVRRNMQYLFYLLQVSEKRLINQGVYNTIKNVKFLGQKNVGQLLKMMKEGNNDIERNLNRVVSKIPNSPSYWNAPRSQLKCLSETHGPATFFITFSPGEYDWEDMHTYLGKHNKDLLDDGISMNSLSTMDPVLTSVFIHQRFQSIHRFILESDCLGKVEHWFYRIEYQSRGTPHFHCLYWIKDAPIVGQSSDEAVMKFISDHITCEFPSISENAELHNLVSSYQCHKCGNYCLKAKKSKKGTFCKSCRFGFPRRITSKLILYDVIESILGRKSSDFKKNDFTILSENQKKQE